MTSAIWFRNDLRVLDNPALISACKAEGNVYGFYFYTEDQFKQHGLGATKLRFILESVAALSEQLEQLNIPLIAVHCSDFDESIEKLLELCEKCSVKDVFANMEVELNESVRDKKAHKELSQRDITLSVRNGQTLLSPGQVLTEKEEPYKVFTAFKRQWLKRINDQSTKPLPAPKKRKKKPCKGTATTTLLSWQQTQPSNEHWTAGSSQAYDNLDQFIEQQIDLYKEKRDYPAIGATSQLSPYLAVGSISVRACIHNALIAKQGQWDSGSQGIQTWLSELIWREFYKHLTALTPDLCKGVSMQPKTRHLPWSHDSKLLTRWQQGETGYPIVDAGMRQLNTLGWMHNRLRMVTAMFLTKHLFIDWRLGEAYFLEKLIDGDYSLNNGGWQWSASTGADAAPYFRIFNPTRQSERFDPDGEFIRQWVPELASIKDKSIHNPSAKQRKQTDYATPLVEHKTATEKTKQIFKEYSSGEPA